MEIMRLYETEIVGANLLRVAAGTTGKRGGDSGHGCRTIIEIEDMGSTDITIEEIKNIGNGGVRITLGGDEELRTIMEALRFILRTLEAHWDDSPLL